MHVDFILNPTDGRPLDASDVDGLSNVKIAGIGAPLRRWQRRPTPANRGALYDKQDFQSLTKRSATTRSRGGAQAHPPPPSSTNLYGNDGVKSKVDAFRELALIFGSSRAATITALQVRAAWKVMTAIDEAALKACTREVAKGGDIALLHGP